jgi:hypothetical protein
VIAHDKGYYATPEALVAAIPVAADGDHAIVDSTATVWLWDDGGWTDSDTKGEVSSVNGQRGEVVLTADDVGATSTRVQTFTESGTWLKPAGARWVGLLLIASGAGGSCGEMRATGLAKGGDSGGGGGITQLWVPADWLSESASVVIGAAGIGAMGRTTDGAQVWGQRGGDVVFTGGLRLRARGGTQGVDDSNGDWGVGLHMGFNAQVGAGTYAWQVPYAQRARGYYTGCISGNPGGGIQATDDLVNPPTANQEGGGAAFVVGAFSDSGPPGPYPDSLFRLGGRGGVGGAASIADDAGDGGPGQNYGAGGGGGGATRTGSRSGHGGDGAPGIALIVTLT